MAEMKLQVFYFQTAYDAEAVGAERGAIRRASITSQYGFLRDKNRAGKNALPKLGIHTSTLATAGGKRAQNLHPLIPAENKKGYRELGS